MTFKSLQELCPRFLSTELRRTWGLYREFCQQIGRLETVYLGLWSRTYGEIVHANKCTNITADATFSRLSYLTRASFTLLKIDGQAVRGSCCLCRFREPPTADVIRAVSEQLGVKLEPVRWLPGFFTLPQDVKIAASEAYRTGQVRHRRFPTFPLTHSLS
jgi:hypothetical protein